MSPAPLPSLQAGRAIAAISVVAFHANRTLQAPRYGGTHFLDAWFTSGTLGVFFFFALSGFIILHAHADDIGKPRMLGRYVWRRFSRIYPIYWLCLTATIAALIVIGRVPGELPANYALFDTMERPRIIALAWTLFHETLFYSAFACLIISRWLGVAVFAAWIALALAFPNSGLVIAAPINICFLLGMAGCLGAMKLPPKLFPVPFLLGIAGLCFVIWETQAANNVLGVEHPYLAFISCAAMAMGLAMADKAKAWRVPRLLLFLGAASYSIYLVHLAAISVLAKMGASLAFLIILSVAAGSALHALVERPLLNKLRA